jgi:hypothetical protein
MKAPLFTCARGLVTTSGSAEIDSSLEFSGLETDLLLHIPHVNLHILLYIIRWTSQNCFCKLITLGSTS